MATFELFNDLPVAIKQDIRRIQAKASADRTTAEAAVLTNYDAYLTNEALEYNAANEITRAQGKTVPTGYSGFAKGATFIEYDAADTVRGVYVNQGTTTTALWEQVGGEQNEARTATADGTGTGQISANTRHVTVTSADANNIITLPAPVVGKRLTIHVGATGFELRSSAPATIAINGGSGADAESAIAANSTLDIICVSATAWKGTFMDADGDIAKIEAAA